MTGVVGFIDQFDHDYLNKSKLVYRMAKEISYTGSEILDRWNDRYLAITRLHHGIMNVDSQPIFNEDGSLCIIMDGELFDYQSQRRNLLNKGHNFCFGKENYAEYCLHAYEEYGLEAFKYFNGSFLIAIYNLESNELILANDRFSSIPLFYYYDNLSLVFGTQLRSVLKYPNVPRRLNLQAVFEFFTFQRVLGERTFYEDIKVLYPGSVLHFRKNDISLHRYWTMQYDEGLHSEEYYVEKLANSLKKAIKRRTTSKHRYGILLSGGLDSRAVLAATEIPIISFTLGDYQNNEVVFAQRVAAKKGSKHIFLRRDRNYYPDLIDEAIDIGDGMYRFDHAHFIGFMKRIREESDIVLHGHGLDYTFQGLYLPYAKLRVFGKTITLPTLAHLEMSNLTREIIENYSYSLYDKPKKIFSRNVSIRYRELIYNSTQGIIKNNTLNDDVYNVWDYFVLHSLYKHFTYLNFLCVRAYINDRTVIFDNDLFDLYLSMPPELRAGGKVYRKALGRIGLDLFEIPNANTGLRADMPLIQEWLLTIGIKSMRELRSLVCSNTTDSNLSNGSWPNKSELIRNNDKMRQIIYKTIRDEECIDPDLFDIDSIEMILNRHLSGEKDSVDLLFLLVTYGRWYKRYGP